MEAASAYLYIILAFLAALTIVVFQYYAIIKKQKHLYLWFTAILRFLSVFLILVLLFNPKYKKNNAYLEKPVLTVAIDNSSSISELNQDQTVVSVINALKQNEQINNRFNVSYYTFGNTVNNSSNPDFSEKQTKISDVLQTFTRLNKEQSQATLLISDGNQTFGKDYSYQNTLPKQKVYPILIGDTTKITDLNISKINNNKYAFSGNKFPVEFFLNYDGEAPVTTKFSVFQNNKTIYTENVSFKTGAETLIKKIILSADNEGVQVYKASLNTVENEVNTINNTKEFAIEVIDQKTEILIVSDILHPDLGALKKSIESNKKRVATFAKSNVAQDIIDKSQLIILYQPNPAFSSIFNALKTQKRNYLTITGTKTNWRFLNQIQDNFTKEWIRQTEEIQAEKNNNYGVFNIDEVSFEEYPPLEGFLGDITFYTPYETVLYNRIRNITLETPLLATYEKEGIKFGLLNGENLWKWRAYNFVANENFIDFDTFLGKLIFYLSNNKKRERLTVDYKSFYDGSNELKISATYFNKNYEFDDGANLLLSITNTETNASKEIPLVLKGNYYEADISNFVAGSYNFKVAVKGENISKSGNFKILTFDIEKQFLTADKEKMLRLAKSTGGQLFTSNQLAQIEKVLLEEASFKPIQKNK